MLVVLCEHYSKTKKLKKELLLNFTDIKVQIKSCIGMCKSCKSDACASVDGTKIKKGSTKKFIKTLKLMQ